MSSTSVDTLTYQRRTRLLYLITGGLQASNAPLWLDWLKTNRPDLEVRFVVTRSALRFTTRTTLGIYAGESQGFVDEWPEDSTALHVELAAWADGAIVHPATFNFITRFSQGIGDTPALLALQCMRGPIVVCPGLPPGGHLNPAYQRNVLELTERDNVTVLPPVYGRSMSTGEHGLGVVAPFTAALAALEESWLWERAMK